MKTAATAHLFLRAFTWLDLLAVIIATATFASPPLIATAQTNGDALTNHTDENRSPPSRGSPTPAQQARAFELATEKIRTACVQGRRIICGRIVKILPDGLAVDSGYTTLMRPPLNKSWLIPGTVEATRESSMVEGNEPGCACVGLVIITDVPKLRSAKPKLYDYVVIQCYPIGQSSYTSVGNIRRTVRRYSATLATAVKVNRAAAGIQPPVIIPEPRAMMDR